jgi:hypothetical protein
MVRNFIPSSPALKPYSYPPRSTIESYALSIGPPPSIVQLPASTTIISSWSWLWGGTV